MKAIIFFLLSFFLISNVHSGYEDADAVYEKISREYTLNSDGSMVFREYKRLKFQSQLAFNRLYGETFIVYNPEFQKLNIHDCYTIMADGTKIQNPLNAFNEVLPRNAAQSATYNHLREMVVTHAGLEIGATYVLDYSITTKKDFWPALMGEEMIRESSPVVEKEVIVKIPSKQQLNFKLFHLNQQPEIVVRGSERIYIWKFSHIDATSKEPFQGNQQPLAPRLIFNTAKDYQALVGWITQQPAFDFTIDDGIKKSIDKIKSGSDDEMKTILALQKEVTQHMAFDRVEPRYTGFRSRKPVEIWKSNGGTQMEKTLVLTAMLQQAGYQATPVLVGSGGLFDPKVANLLQLNEFLIEINTSQNGMVYISATTSENLGLENRFTDEVTIPVMRKGNLTPVFHTGKSNVIAFKSTLTVDTNLNIAGTIEGTLQGATNPFFSLLESQNNIKSFITGGITKTGDESIQNISATKEESKFGVLAEKNQPFTENAGYYRWTLPVMNQGFEGWRINFLASTRYESFLLPHTLTERYEYVIDLPSRYEFVNKANIISLTHAIGSVNIEITPNKHQISIIRELQLKATTISPEQYADFRELINAWLDKNGQSIVFSRKTNNTER